ncbi:MAG: hypothetical protein A2268_14325 [Candidatus Raymondbacteria bacterium RifOxyA12_full_50_37]|nr:MAG: hypothetical protein A2268_14325 [Candidatus Raymondbacteria bacterium RifOxyA12_full_50_37]OGJ88256.1 MAG: hypothetical protein A2248_19665 [Candidatus Raymondbacteria bacterium RIFOXYA2_FULL_49_16]OGK05757.1 MAG: hypothetical protein A2487_19635 [Candidatus Raymondbacteria bacterium RifOxyC12_full_50_8]OGP41070.1 MAG: hypothetical protein A2324_06290 [Candidatus Raymondbacteria bacterium RIFOXYB2_FULL_49_35]
MTRVAILIFLTVLPLPSLAAWGKSAPPSEELKWFELKGLQGRLEQEYDRLEIVEREVDRLRSTVEDIGALRLYPASCTNLSKERILSLDKSLKEYRRQVTRFNDAVAALTSELGDAIGIFKELVYEDQERTMLQTLDAESKERVKRVILLKREINNLWKTFNVTLDSLSIAAGMALPERQRQQEGDFDSEFFEVLYSNLGMSSDLFFKRLSAYKDHMLSRADSNAMAFMATVDLKNARIKFDQGNFIAVRRELSTLVIRFEGKIKLSGIYFYLGQATQALGKYADALLAYAQVRPTSQYYAKALLNILQCHLALQNHLQVISLFEKEQEVIDKIGTPNEALFVACQAYYALKNEKAIVEVSARARKNTPLYEGILYVLGQSYLARGDRETAQTIFEKIIEIARSYKADRLFVDRAAMALAHLDFEAGNYRQALKQYLVLLDREKLFAEALEGIAWCYLYLGNYEKAEIALKKLVNQAPQSPSGCDALLTLAKSYLKQATLEWENRKDLKADADHIGRLRRLLDKRRASGEVDSARYAVACQRLDQIEVESKKRDVLSYDDINALYVRANDIGAMLVRSYRTGEFIKSASQNQQQELLIKLRDLYLRVTAAKTGMLQKDVFREREEQSRARETIAATVVQTRLFLVKTFLERREWENEYLQFYIGETDSRIAAMQRDSTLSDSARISGIENLVRRKTAAIAGRAALDASDRTAMITELTALSGENLTDKEEQFVLYYLGELSYQAADESYGKKVTTYEQAMSDFRNGTVAERPAAPVMDYSMVKAYLTKLIEKYPGSEFGDGALYSLTFCHRWEDSTATAIWYAEQLVKKYPQSQYAPQTYMIIGEYYFDENKLEMALAAYQKVLQFPESKWFDKALYKIGWAYYRLSNFEKTISSLFYIVNEQDELAEGGLNLDVFAKSLLTKESIDYIAISFAEGDTTGEEMAGLKRARRFVDKINNEYIGSKILHKLGDVYREQLKYENAIATYKALRDKYSNYREMPRVMYNIIECYEQRGGEKDFQAALTGRQQLFKKYNHTAEWNKAVGDSVAAVLGDSLAEQALIEASSSLYSRALEKNSKDLYRQVIDMYWDYIKTYPYREKAGEYHYYIAEILFGTGDYSEAANQYITVSRTYRASKYCETAAWNAIVAARRLLEVEEKEANGGNKSQ